LHGDGDDAEGARDERASQEDLHADRRGDADDEADDVRRRPGE
jgi:hypothetical protein